MAAEADRNNILRFTYTGEENTPEEATHIFVDAAFIPAEAFYEHPNIVEVICHFRVKKIQMMAFARCPNLGRVIMPGVKIVKDEAFCDSEALTDVECGMLEIIGEAAFQGTSLRSINLPSARTLDEYAFGNCATLTDVKFGNKLERFERMVFTGCFALERITIPLKDGMFPYINPFLKCVALKRVDLVDEGALREIIAALQLKKWRNDIKQEIDSINRILPTALPGYYNHDFDYDYGEKVLSIRTWIGLVLRKIIHYKGEHQRLLNEAANTLQPVLPRDIVTNNILSFLALPSHTFGGEDEER